MRIAGEYSFNGGKEALESKFGAELQEIKRVIAGVGTETQRAMYRPGFLEETFKMEFEARHWQKYRVACKYIAKHYVPSYRPSASLSEAFRELDFVMNRVGMEVHLAKHTSVMVCSVCAQMAIFHKHGCD